MAIIGAPLLNRDNMDNVDQVVADVLKGDINRYRDIVAAYEGKVRAVVAAMVPDPNQVPDLTQEVFVIAYQHLATYKSGTHFLAWLRSIARNVSQNERRRWYRRHEMEERFRGQVDERMEAYVETLVDDLPEDMLVSLRDCVNRLPGRTREVMDGFYYKQSSVNELAERLRITVSSAKVILHRARQALGSCLQKKGHDHV